MFDNNAISTRQDEKNGREMKRTNSMVTPIHLPHKLKA